MTQVQGYNSIRLSVNQKVLILYLLLKSLMLLCSPFSAGKMKGIAFITDPDGYWIEILNPNIAK